MALANHTTEEPRPFGVRGFDGGPLARVLEKRDGDQQLVMAIEIGGMPPLFPM